MTHHTTYSRRQQLSTSALGALGIASLPNLNASSATPSGPGFGNAKRVIVLNMKGGMSHIDTLDPKTSSAKGPVGPIKTSADFQVSEYLPKIAKIAHKISLVRSMTAKVGVHGPAQYVMRTAFTERSTIKHPNLGAWAEHYLGKSHDSLPASVCINQPSRYGNGFFPASMSPLPILNPETGIKNIRIQSSLSQLKNKLQLKDSLSSDFIKKYQDKQVSDYQTFYQDTLRLLKSKDLSAFELSHENKKTLETYGSNELGKGCLLARRLIEAGVRFVEVDHDGWDVHKGLSGDMPDLCATLDQAYTALILDLEQRGLLESTLVVLTTEFGRKPQYSGDGRGHYPICFSTALAGAGIKQGFVYGKSDKMGMTANNPVSIGDFHATIGHAAGLPMHKVYKTQTGRPFVVGGEKAKPITELFA